jgi:hypothetical protein
MKRRLWLSGLIVAFLGLGMSQVQAQEILPRAGNDRLPPPVPEGNNSSPARNGYGPGQGANNFPNTGSNWARPDSSQAEGRADQPTIGPGISSWLAYPRCNCCGPVGDNGPIATEAYARTGVSVPFGPGVLAPHLTPGFWMQAGGRSLFFDPPATAAWVVDLGLSTVWYGPDHPTFVTLHHIPGQMVTNPGTPFQSTTTINLPDFSFRTGALNQSFLNISLGRECYLWGTGSCTTGCVGPNWRVGWDAGGRWGTAKLSIGERVPLPDNELTPLRHKVDVVGGFFVALHSDLEVPLGCSILFAGFRAEYGYIWSDILQSQNNADIQSVNFLFNIGLRY